MTQLPLRAALFAFASLAAAGTLAENVLIAQATQPGASQSGTKATFEALDKDHDGKVSLNEATERDDLFVAFKNLDTNKDGVLTREEFAAYQRERPEA